MPTITPCPVDAPDAHELLAEYFAMRVATFPGHTYTTCSPTRRCSSRPPACSSSCGDERGQTPSDAAASGASTTGLSGHATRSSICICAPRRAAAAGAALLLEDLERRAVAFGARELVLDTHHTLEAAGRLYAARRVRGDRSLQRQSERDALVREARSARLRPGRPRASPCAARPADGRGRCATGASTGDPASARSRSDRSAPG